MSVSGFKKLPKKLDDTKNQCWKCSNLKMYPEHSLFFCDKNGVQFLADEVIPDLTRCMHKNSKRKKLSGTSSLLLRLLCVYPDGLIVRSLPNELVGCIGNLIAQDVADVIPVETRKYGRNKSYLLSKEKMVVLKRPIEGDEVG